MNCWHFTDYTGIVLRLAAKAYALTGTDDEKLRALQALAATDYLTAIQGKVPQRFILNVDGDELVGAIPAAALQMDPVPVYEDMFELVAQSLPEVFRFVNDQYEPFSMELREPFLWVSTCVFEEPDGTLVARVS